ncbi:MAG: winged helix-turn-helix domain-containing protein [Acidobacteriota bacterium]|nr:winged helix-turn-helix domain-containing protein [Acidobacteriota bacterium]
MGEAPQSVRMVRFGVFEADLRSGELRKQGIKVKLQEQPFQVLFILLEHAGEVVTREELRRKVWTQNTFVDFEHSLATAINKIREALGDRVGSPRFIETLPKRGYRFIAPIECEHAPGMSAAAPQPDAMPSAIALDSRGLPEHPLRWRESGTGTIDSLAVLPLINLSAEQEQEYFADGMTDELIANLGQISSLRVISRTSAMRYKGTAKNVREIASELNVDAVVEGSVRRSGDRVRITAQLIYAPADRHVWAHSYEGDLRDVLGLQSQVAQAISGAIQAKLTPQEQARLAYSRAVYPEAHELYLKGLYFWNTNRNQRDLTKAIELFQQAIERDPSDALAYAGLSDAYSSLVGWDVLPPSEAIPKAKAAAARALQNDDSLAEAHGSLGHAEMYDWDFAGAETEFERAIQLNPSYATAHWFYALDLSKMGKLDEAVAETCRARTLDPISHVSNEVSGWIFYLARRYDRAIEAEQKALEMDASLAPARFYLGLAYEQELKYPEAIEELEKAVALSGAIPQFAGALGHAYGVSGKRSEAIKILERLGEQSKRTYVSPFSMAILYAGLGEKEATFEFLEKAFRGRAQCLTNLKVDPRFDVLRSDPRFQDLMRGIHLIP